MSITLPVLKAQPSPRQLQVSWSFNSKFISSGLNYQLSIAEAETLEYHVVYEGPELTALVSDLKPNTQYKLKCKLLIQQQWSKEYSELQVKTMEETLVSKLTLQFMRALAEGDIEKTALLLSENKQMSVETRDKNGRTCLMVACETNSPENVVLLLQHGAQLTATTRSGKTALIVGISYGSLEAIQALLSFDKSLLEVADVGQSTPLMWAAENVNTSKKGLQVLEYLISCGADIHRLDLNGSSAFDRLCTSCGSVKGAQVLVAAGAKIISKVDKHHPMTSLMTAALNGHRELSKYLMELCDPRVKTEHGLSAKHLADSNGHKAIVNMIEDRLSILAQLEQQ